MTVAFDIVLIMVLVVYGMWGLVIVLVLRMAGDVCVLWGWMRNVADMGSRI